MAGNIRIIEPTSKFQKVSKGVIFDKRIDPFTLGIYVKVIALGKEWELNISGLATALGVTDGRIRKAFAVLEDVGYLRRERARDANNRFCGWNYEICTIPFSDLTDSRPSENPDVGKNRTSEKREVYNKDFDCSKDKKTTSENIKETPFDFRAELIRIGVTPEVADAWLEVRKAKRGVNTKLAFKEICIEIGKTGRTADECIRKAVARNWCGFEAAWMQERPTPQAPRPQQARPFRESPEEYNLRRLAELQARDGMLHTFSPDEQ